MLCLCTPFHAPHDRCATNGLCQRVRTSVALAASSSPRPRVSGMSVALWYLHADDWHHTGVRNESKRGTVRAHGHGHGHRRGRASLRVTWARCYYEMARPRRKARDVIGRTWLESAWLASKYITRTVVQSQGAGRKANPTHRRCRLSKLEDHYTPLPKGSPETCGVRTHTETERQAHCSTPPCLRTHRETGTERQAHCSGTLFNTVVSSCRERRTTDSVTSCAPLQSNQTCRW